MTRRVKTWAIATGVLLLYALAAWGLGVLLRPRLQPQDLTMLRYGLLGLGVLSAAVVLWFFRAPDAPKAAGDDTDAAFAQARGRLAAAKQGNLATLPTVLLLGPQGSAKTTSIVRSGLAAELLAGEALRGEAVAPTSSVNVWFAQNAVFVEAGGPLAADASRWQRLLRHVQPARLRAAATGGAQAPRAAVVCYSCEELVTPGAAERAAAAARDLRARLGELSQSLGVRLPVYVLFTKADKLPHFDAFVQHLTPDEARQPLGAGLAADRGPAGTYAERAGAAIGGAFEELYRSLALWRLPVLHRENAPERKPGAYEFPREVRKVQPVVVDFLRELCKPSHLDVSPVLRGFYFTGVQAVYVTDGAAPAPAAAAVPAAAAASATQVFSSAQARAAAAPAYTPPSTRKVARWDFLEGLLRDVVLADAPALQATTGGTRLNVVRRALLATAAAAALVVAAGFTVSYRNNRALEREVAASAQALAGMPAGRIDLASVDALQRLDGVRRTLERLGTYQREGAPMSMRWGLYAGDRLHEPVRRLYFDGFEKLLFGGTRASLASTLRALPPESSPGDEYGLAYDQLKAYLITTSHPQHASMSFLPDALLRAWASGRTVDDERRRLARAQFETYTREVVVANPFSHAPDAGIVSSARGYLRSFQGIEPIYRGLLTEAAKRSRPVRFAEVKPEAARVVSAPYEVQAAFTKDGWAFMQRALQNPEALGKGEAWVVGEQAVIPAADRQRTIGELRRLYESQYANEWRTFLRTASVASLSVGNALGPLERLAGNQSPVLELFSVVSQHTAAPAMAKIFQPARSLVPAGGASLVNEANQPWLQAVGGLRDAIRQVASAPPGGRQGLVDQAKSSAGQVESTVATIALTFTPDSANVVDAQVARLLRQAGRVQGLEGVSGGDANAAGMRLCSAIGGTIAKFPFNLNATQSASAAEVAELLRPGTGTFWTIYQQSLTGIAVRQGNVFQPVAGAPYRVSPQFLLLLGKLARMSDMLFPNGAQQPRAMLNVRLDGAPQELSAVTLNVDGDPMRTTQNDMTATLTVPGAPRDARLTVTQGSTESVVASAPAGPWAVLRIFHQATRVTRVGESLRFEWAVPNVMRAGGGGEPVRVAATVSQGAATALLLREEISGGSCGGRIAY